MSTNNSKSNSRQEKECEMIPCRDCGSMIIFSEEFGNWAIHKCPPSAFYPPKANPTPPVPKLAREFDDCYLCGHQIDSVSDGWGIHECPKKLDSQGKLTKVQSAPKKPLPDTPDIWTPGLPWYSPAKVQELNNKIKEQDTIFEMERIPQYNIKPEKQKINLYEQVPFVVSIHYSNWC